jgi:hypothetical protein
LFGIDNPRSAAMEARVTTELDDVTAPDELREQLRLRGPLLQSANGGVSTGEIDERQALASGANGNGRIRRIAVLLFA